METYDFIYELKKALNLRIFNNPAVASDFIDIIHDYFNKSFDNHMTYFNYNDAEHEITMTFTYDSITSIVMNDILNISILEDKRECVYKFLSMYVTSISLALNDLSGREYAHQFEDYMLGQYKKLLGEICYVTSWVNQPSELIIKFRLY